jgi:hypothetical protein
MKINEDFARYILSLQDIAIMERGEEEIDRLYRTDIEAFFVQLKEEREHKEFVAWVHKEKIEADPRVVELRKKIEEDTKDNASDSFANIYRKREIIFKDLDDLREGLAELYLQDKEVKNEWRILASVNKMLGIKKEE